MATFVMQSVGCEVAALNTVHFSEYHQIHMYLPVKPLSFEDMMRSPGGFELSSLLDGVTYPAPA